MAETPERTDDRCDVSEPDRVGTDGESGPDRVGTDGESTPDTAGQSFALFGDRAGLAVFLGAFCIVGLTWQVGVFITDTYAVANGLVSVADGHFAVERLHYSLTLSSQPGLSAVDGNLYARNYGQAFLALPVYYLLEVGAGVVDLHLLLVATWAVAFAVFCRQIGGLTDRRGTFSVAGSALGASIVLVSVPFVDPVDEVALVALQIVSMLAVAVTALALYRLVVLVRGRRLGVAFGAATVLATPVWFWAAVPKRHALTAAAVATLLYWFAASRERTGRVRLPVAGSVGRSLSLRVAGYLLVGLVAWVHAFEGVLLLGAFAVSDLATTSATARRALLAVAVALAVGFAPFFATNLAVTGNPAEPPRMASSYFSADEDYTIGPGGEVFGPGAVVADTDEAGDASTTDSTTGESGTTDSTTGESDRSGTRDPFATATSVTDQFASHGSKFVDAIGSAPARLYRTYVRSGRAGDLSNYDINDEEAIDLSLLESHPLFGGLATALAGLVVSAVARGRRRFSLDDGRPGPAALSPGRWLQRARGADPARQTDGFAALVGFGFAVMYFPLLPLHSQLTVRYLLPAVPPLLYLLARVPAVAGPIERRPRSLVGSYAATVATGLLGVAVVFPRLDLAVGEAIQLHGLVNLTVAAAVGAAVLARYVDLAGDRVPAVALGIAAGATTVLVVAMQLAYFPYGTYAVAPVELVAETLRVL